MQSLVVYCLKVANTFWQANLTLCGNTTREPSPRAKALASHKCSYHTLISAL